LAEYERAAAETCCFSKGKILNLCGRSFIVYGAQSVVNDDASLSLNGRASSALSATLEPPGQVGGGNGRSRHFTADRA